MSDKKCAFCDETDELGVCPCGREVCFTHQEPIYCDEICCTQCAIELKEQWSDCPKHELDEPYENEDGDLIAECKHCSHPERVRAGETR